MVKWLKKIMKRQNNNRTFISTKKYKNMKKEFKVGDKVVISKKSRFYGEDHYSNPTDVKGTITRIKEYDTRETSIINSLTSGAYISANDYLGIKVEWDNGMKNAYSEVDLELAKKESYIHDEEKINQPLKPKAMINAISITDVEQIKALCEAIPSIKEQVQKMYPELFEVHKAGNKYIDELGEVYILATEHNAVALVDLLTGKIGKTVYVNDINHITADEMELVYDGKEYELA